MDISEPSLKHLFPIPRRSKGLTSAELSRLEAVSLAQSDFRNYFEFDRDWDFFRLDAELRTLFPRLFSYFDRCPKVCAHLLAFFLLLLIYYKVINKDYESSQDSRFKYLPPYLLCLRSHKEIAVVSGINFPTGEVVFEKVKAGKRPARDEAELIFGMVLHPLASSVLIYTMVCILVTRDVIPHRVVEEWTRSTSKGKGRRNAVDSSSDSDIADFASRRAGSDSEADSLDDFIAARHPKRICIASKSPCIQPYIIAGIPSNNHNRSQRHSCCCTPGQIFYD